MSNLLREILERIEYERLIEEGKDPVELIHHKFQYIPTEIIDDVIEIDPTKKKSYSQWLLSKWNDEEETIVKNLENGRIAQLFQYFKEHNDVQIKDYGSVGAPLQEFIPEECGVLVKSSAPTTILRNNHWKKQVSSELANDFDIVYDDGDWVIAVPHTYEADCKLGENMYWCTAGGRTSFETGRNWYERYLEDSPNSVYYVNFDMSRGESGHFGGEYPFTRYQFHFESNQFMDKNDDKVDLSSIGISEGAKEFYADQGFDTDEFEDLDLRIERYEEERYHNSYDINDDLYLCPEYDDDLVYREPDENTDFFLFSVDDSRDPISWDAIPNPFANEGVVILNEDGLCIIKTNNDNVIVAMNIRSSYGYYHWDASTFVKYLLLPDNMGVFGVNDSKHFCFVSDNGETEYKKFRILECDGIFINEPCTKADSSKWGMIFIEAVADGYHSLFAYSQDTGAGDDFDMIVKRDTPINGQCFTINEQGLVQGEFRSYRVYNDDEYEQDENYHNYDLEMELNTGDYLVSRIDRNDYGDEYMRFNIIKRGGSQLLIDPWFDKYIGCTANLYGVSAKIETNEMANGRTTYSERIGFFKISDGQQVGEWYDSYDGIDQEKDILFGRRGEKRSPIKVDIIDGNRGAVMVTFRDVISSRAINNKIIVRDGEHYSLKNKVFDYVEGKFYFPELSGFIEVSRLYHPYIFLCTINESDERALFDLASQRVVVRGLDRVAAIYSNSECYLKLFKMDGKLNIFDMNKLVELLPFDADEILGKDYGCQNIVFSANGKYYAYNIQRNEFMINPKGSDVPCGVDNQGYVTYYEDVANGKVFVSFSLISGEFMRWRMISPSGEYLGVDNVMDKNTPKEVIDLYNRIIGASSSVSESFKRMVHRINEADKLKYNDIID